MTAGQRAMPGDRRAEAQTPSIAVWARLPSCMLLILLLSSGLRFYNLGTQSFWNDEGNTARLVERPIRLIIEGAAGDIHPPGYYLLLHTWRAAVGDSEYALRAFSALCGVLTVAVAAAASRAAIGQRGQRLTIWATATLVAVHPLAVAYSQEARMYAQLGLASALTLWAALVLVRRDARATRRRHLLATLALAAGVGLGLYTQYAYALALVGLNLAFSLYWLTARPWRWPLLSRWVVGHVLGGLLFAPWAPIALGARGWQPPDLATGEAFRALTRTLLVGTTLPEGIAPIVLACACLVGLWTLVISLHARPGSATRFAAWASLCMALVPLALITAAGLYRPAYLKFLMVSVAPLAVALALPLHKQTRTESATLVRRVRIAPRQVAVTGLLAGLLLTQVRSLRYLYNDPAFARDDYRGIARLLRDEGRAGDAILLSAPNQWEVFTYYYRVDRGDALPVYPAPYRPTAAEAETWVSSIVTNHQSARLFVLFWGDLESDPERAIEHALSRLAFKADDTWITSVRLARYGTGALPTTPSVQTAGALLDGGIRLTGYDIATPSYHPGDCVPLTLFWQAETAVDEPLKVFVHLVDQHNTIVAQADMEPQAGFMSTTAWNPGNVIVDRYGLCLPRALTPGTYALRVGMYRSSGERLTIASQGTPSSDYLELTQITVTP